MASALSVTEAKVTLNITGTASDTALQNVINEAESILGERVGPLVPVSRTDRVSCVDGLTLALPFPATGVPTSITHAWAGDSYLAAELYLEHDTIVSRGYKRPLRVGPWDVVYQAGYSTLPPAILRADRELVVHLWQQQRGTGGRPGSAPTDNPRPFTLPNRVLEAIQPYLLDGFA